MIRFQDSSVQVIMMHEKNKTKKQNKKTKNKKNLAAGEQGYKIYTKILEQWTWLKLQQ